MYECYLAAYFQLRRHEDLSGSAVSVHRDHFVWDVSVSGYLHSLELKKNEPHWTWLAQPSSTVPLFENIG